MLKEGGAFVDTSVRDGASTNRLMWKAFGASGVLYSIKHFFYAAYQGALQTKRSREMENGGDLEACKGTLSVHSWKWVFSYPSLHM